ncbi:hypothetical protein HY994_04875 [Candidatus Micrarchaeota archaeon]|nr:hypothetical protein [Candidatus Micrarchaeota archaeon]
MVLPKAYRPMVSKVNAAIQAAGLENIKNLQDLKETLAQPPTTIKIRSQGLVALGVMARATERYLDSIPSETLHNLNRDIEKFVRV